MDGGVHQGGVARHHRVGGGAQERGDLGKDGTLHGTDGCPTQVLVLSDIHETHQYTLFKGEFLTLTNRGGAAVDSTSSTPTTLSTS